MKIYFIGIGGIGVSAIAKYYLRNEHEVFGSDPYNSEIIEALKNEGAKIFIGPQIKEHIQDDIDLVIYSPAIQENNAEFKETKNKGIEILSYPEALGLSKFCLNDCSVQNSWKIYYNNYDCLYID